MDDTAFTFMLEGSELKVGCRAIDLKGGREVVGSI
jgi:hypothetical protein